ncbi:MAG: RNA polymerase factor sigma-54 [Muribaculaceae bacterium]|nr:RNA polymerase factor sigma-54 [Muribaculaceae bacterium]
MKGTNDNLRLEQQSKLQQRLNPQQVIFGRYLEMTAPEIEEEVRRALDENPALEAVGEVGVSDADDISADQFGESAEQLQRADYGDEDEVPVYGAYSGGYDSDGNGHDLLSTSESGTLMDVLTAQLADIDLNERERLIAEHIIGNLDDNGYMTRSLTDIADDITIAEGVTVDVPEVKTVFAKIRRLDPAGVGAVDLRDCLLLQIDRFPHTLTSKIAREIIADWFDLFSKKHFDQLRSHLGIDEEQMHATLDFIRGLNPKPGALVEGDTVNDRLRHIIPDFAVDVDCDGHMRVSLLNSVPELAIEDSFKIDDTSSTPISRREADAQAFIKRRHDDASAFISMLKMRADTLLSVMKAIAKIQHRFFETNDRSTIRPMIIKDVAAETGLNISVISRAAAGKYVLTAHGIYPLKMFFNERPKEDADTSSHEILEALTKIIDNEDKRHPLSDDALSQLLDAKGYRIARRTVTKYREKLGQPVARLRKQF